MPVGILANKFLDVCGEWLEEHDWLRVRSKLEVFSSVAVVWLSKSAAEQLLSLKMFAVTRNVF